MPPETEPAAFQRLDHWLWCARFARTRADTTRLVAAGGIRLNRQSTDKPHAKLRPGDVLTLPTRGEILILRVMALALRRGSAKTARELYEMIPPTLSSPLPLWEGPGEG